MKQVICISMLLLSFQCSFAQVLYFKGEWTRVNKHDLFSGIFKIEIKKDGTANAEFVWTYLATDSTSHDLLDTYAGKKGKTGTESAEGFFSSATNDFYFEGKEKNDPHFIIGLDKYHVKLAANKQVIYGTTETEGTYEGLLYAVKMNNTTGQKEFLAAKAKVKN